MKVLISILIVLALIFGGWKLWEYWDQVSQQKDMAEKKPSLSEDQLGSMTSDLEKTLQDARKKGPSALKAWLDKNQKNPKIPESRLVYIKLDYVLMIASSDPVEAKKVFHEIKQNTPPTSPVYPRIKE